MCGIAGFYNDNIDRKKTILAMNERMIHRGPDAGGYWLDEHSGWTFGHRRLSILDLSANGAQPMMSASKRFVMSYNGEIYNISSLREKIKIDGYNIKYKGSSDTEVLLEAFEIYGVNDTISNCKGMFAIALYDRKDNTLYLIRDRVGEKPLYYGFVKNPNTSGRYFAFASDLALFSELPGFEKEIDRNALAEYMLYNYIPAPMSIFSHIYKLEPGSILTLKEPFTEPVITKYWSMIDAAVSGEENIFNGSEEEASEHLEELLRNAISEQMVADVPVGAFLSGGIDSSAIVAIMQSISSQPINTFTIGFDDPKYNESDYARDIARHLGTNHTEKIITEKEMMESIPKMAYLFSEPFGDASMIPTYFVSKIAKEKVTVTLSGDAGDELFCGYDGYWKSNSFWNKAIKVPTTVRGTLADVLKVFDGVSDTNYHRMVGLLEAQMITQLKDVVFNRKNYCAEHIVVDGYAKELSTLKNYLNDNISAMELQDMLEYHPDDILVKVDRAGMGVSLENRIPMLDKDVIEFAWTIPSEYKYKDGISKRVLRNILYKYVPREMMERPKQGFCVPLEKWLMQGNTNEWAADLMNHSKLVESGLLDENIVDFTWNSFVKKQRNTRLVWNILMAEQWFRYYI